MLNESGSSMLTLSVLPSSEVARRFPTETDGMMIVPGRFHALRRCRVSQPLEVVLLPGVPRSMYSMASKWLRFASDSPAATTMPRWFAWKSSCRAMARGFRPKPAVRGMAAFGPVTGTARSARALS
jgi:hypothetical protein